MTMYFARVGLGLCAALAMLSDARANQYTLTIFQNSGSSLLGVHALNAAGQSAGFGTIFGGDPNAYFGMMWSPSGAATVLQDPGGQQNNNVSAMNASGQAVGVSARSRKTSYAVLWSPSGAATILQGATSGANNTGANAINASGLSVGSSGTEAMLWSPSGAATRLKNPFYQASATGHRGCRANAINKSGQSVGWCYANESTAGAVRWSANGEATKLRPLTGDSGTYAAAINDSGESVGESGSASGAVAALWNAAGTPTALANLPGGVLGEAIAVNSAGYSIGYSEGNGQDVAVLWSPKGVVTALQTLVIGSHCNVSALNDDGQVVGECGNLKNLTAPVIWSKSGKVTSLELELPYAWRTGYVSATQINNAGQIAVCSWRNNIYDCGLLTPVKTATEETRAP